MKHRRVIAAVNRCATQNRCWRAACWAVPFQAGL